MGAWTPSILMPRTRSQPGTITRRRALTRARPAFVCRWGRWAPFNLPAIANGVRGWLRAAALHPHSSESEAHGEPHHLPLQPRLTMALSTVITWLSEQCVSALFVCVPRPIAHLGTVSIATRSSSVSEDGPPVALLRLCTCTSGVDHIGSR